jgi:hypothetical protein
MKPRYRNSWKISIALAVALLLLASTAFAADAPLVGDGFLNGNTGTWTSGSAQQYVVAQSGGTACAVKTLRATMNFNLTDVTNKITSATLTLHVYSKSGTGNVALVPVSDTSFTSSSVGNLDPGDYDLTHPIGALTAISAIPAAGNPWEVSTQELADYLDARKGGYAALAVIVSECSNGNPNVLFNSSSNTAGYPPTLTYTAPTAVTMSTFQTADPAVNWPLIAGLGALVALAAGGVLFYRKRATTH